jgi:hypothetical protein
VSDRGREVPVSSWTDVAIVTAPAVVTGVVGFAGAWLQRGVRITELETDLVKTRHGAILPLRSERQLQYSNLLAAELEVIIGIANEQFKSQDALYSWTHDRLMGPYTEVILTAPEEVRVAAGELMSVFNRIQNSANSDEEYPEWCKQLSARYQAARDERDSRRRELVQAMRDDLADLLKAANALR